MAPGEGEAKGLGVEGGPGGVQQEGGNLECIDKFYATSEGLGPDSQIEG